MKREVQTYPKVKKIFLEYFGSNAYFANENLKGARYRIEHRYSTSFSYCCNECAIDENDLKKILKKNERLQWKKPKRNEW